jgi:ParB-like chromosome segregation protein Spo0J
MCVGASGTPPLPVLAAFRELTLLTAQLFWTAIARAGVLRPARATATTRQCLPQARATVQRQSELGPRCFLIQFQVAPEACPRLGAGEHQMPEPYGSGTLRYVTSEVTPEAQIIEIGIDDIHVPADMRAVDDVVVERLVESIEAIGLQAQGLLSVRWAPLGSAQRTILIAGRHRLEAFRRLGWSVVPAALFDGSEEEAELWRIAENLCRSELSALERADQIARWMSIRKEKGAQVAQVSGGRGNRGGLSAAAVELGIGRHTIQRGLHVAGLAKEAKIAASRLGLDDNWSALTKAAEAGGPAAQVESLEVTARRKEASERYPESEAYAERRAASKQKWRIQADWVSCAAESLNEWLGPERVRELLGTIDKSSMPEITPVQIIDRLRSLVRKDP